jgi:hypothetical protein
LYDTLALALKSNHDNVHKHDLHFRVTHAHLRHTLRVDLHLLDLASFARLPDLELLSEPGELAKPAPTKQPSPQYGPIASRGDFTEAGEQLVAWLGFIFGPEVGAAFSSHLAATLASMRMYSWFRLADGIACVHAGLEHFASTVMTGVNRVQGCAADTGHALTGSGPTARRQFSEIAGTPQPDGGTFLPPAHIGLADGRVLDAELGKLQARMVMSVETKSRDTLGGHGKAKGAGVLTTATVSAATPAPKAAKAVVTPTVGTKASGSKTSGSSSPGARAQVHAPPASDAGGATVAERPRGMRFKDFCTSEEFEA